MPEMKLDTTEFSKWVKRKVERGRVAAATVLNKAAGDVCLRAVKLTKRADAAKMDKLLKRSGNRGVLLKSGRRSRSKKSSMQEFQASKYVYAVINYYIKHGRMPSYAFGVMPKNLSVLRHLESGLAGSRMGAAARQYVAAKKRSIGYIATGFIMAARFFGKQTTRKVSPKGYVWHSTGKLATDKKLTATIFNFARGAGQVKGINQTLQTAMDSVASDMKRHEMKKIVLAKP